jgi:hypothetical protein
MLLCVCLFNVVSNYIYFVSKNVHVRILDNLPVVVPMQTREGSQTPSFEHGYRVGYKVSITNYYLIS